MKVMIVDDDGMKRTLLRDDLEEAGYEASAVASAKEALKLLGSERFDVIVTDLRMPGMDGIAFLKRVKEDFGEATQVIMMTAYASVDTAVQAIKLGAYDYIPKPFENEELILILDRLREFQSVVEENVRLRRRLEGRYQFHKLIGKSHVMQDVFRLAETVAPSDSTVLICGETGTGKELVANAIHYHSPRKRGPFVKVSCAVLSKELLESELFGHEKGAFTSAIREKVGKFQLAHTGTLFLDEVDDIPLELQVKLLRVLEEHTFERVGGDLPIKVDIRVIAATKADLRQKVARGEFREDLFYRLNVVPILLSPLRDRKEDIPLLMEHFLSVFADRKIDVHPEAMRILLDYGWPGNVRELENLIERLVVVSGDNKEIRPEDLPLEMRSPVPLDGTLVLGSASFTDIIESTERNLILQALEKAGGNKTRAADILQMKLSTFRDKLAKLGMN